MIVSIERARVLLGQGRSIRQTAKLLGCGAATLHRALKDRRAPVAA